MVQRANRILDGCARADAIEGGDVARRRRRTKYTWLPNLGTYDGVAINSAPAQFILDINNTGEAAGGVLPLTFDAAQDRGSPASSTPLIDLMGEEYFLRRIVGKCFCDLAVVVTEGTNFNPNSLPAVLVTAGFYIATQDAGSTGLPVAWTSQYDLYSPLAAETIREPWIWRRTWKLGVPNIPEVFAEGFTGQTHGQSWPRNNYTGSVADGPHVDARTARRIGTDERLWWTVFAQLDPIGSAMPTPSSGSITYQVHNTLDYRLLGAMRRARGKGAF